MDPPARYYDGPGFHKSSKRKQSRSNTQCVWQKWPGCSTTSGPILQYAKLFWPTILCIWATEMTAHWQMTQAILTDDRNKDSNFVTYSMSIITALVYAPRTDCAGCMSRRIKVQGPVLWRSSMLHWIRIVCQSSCILCKSSCRMYSKKKVCDLECSPVIKEDELSVLLWCWNDSWL